MLFSENISEVNLKYEWRCITLYTAYSFEKEMRKKDEENMVQKRRLPRTSNVQNTIFKIVFYFENTK